MEFKEYQTFIEKYIVNRKSGIEYPVLGLCGESGEVAEKVKKVIRDRDGVLDDEIKKEIAKELGDVVWYVTRIGMELGFSFEEIVSMNIEKMKSRFERDAIKGKGDNR
jgi:NTP pyrophosphatase (non-canonical NTP hydrolase)